MSDDARADPAATLRRAMIDASAARPEATSLMSESSIDATLLLHSIGYEPVDFVFGVAAQSFPYQVWKPRTNTGLVQIPRGPIPKATDTFDAAFTRAKESARRSAVAVGADGVVDTTLTVTVQERFITVEVRGTAVRRIARRTAGATSRPFVSDLSARSLVGLSQMGYLPSDFVAGYGFSAASFAQQMPIVKNAENDVLTQAIYESREAAMERLQRSARASGVVGVVGIRTWEQRTLNISIQVVAFGATGTTVVKAQSVTAPTTAPTLTLSLDDSFVTFDPAALNGRTAQPGADDIATAAELTVRRTTRFAELLTKVPLLAHSLARPSRHHE